MASTTKLLILILLIVPSVILGACAQKTVDNTPQIQILEHTMNFLNFGDVLKSIVSVDGKATNGGSTTIGTALIAVNFYDKDNNLLYTASAIKNNLTAGEIWFFNVRFIGPDAWKTVRYEISAKVQ
jgi:hypothetical protein